MLDVMFYEVFKEEEEALRKILPKNIRAAFTWKTVQENQDVKPRAHIICIRTQSRIPADWASKIRGILTRSQGFDHLVSYRKRAESEIHPSSPRCFRAGPRRILPEGLHYGYLGDYCSRAVAEHAILVMLALLRKLKTQIKHFSEFKRDHITGCECKGRNALVIGVGNIGQEIAHMARGLGMRVKGMDIIKRLKNLEYVSLPKGLAWADVIFCSPELTDKTRGLLAYPTLRQVKKGVIFINIARGEISPLQDLKKLLDKGIISALGLDVFPEESVIAEDLRGRSKELRKISRLILGLKDKDNVIFTPHNAFNTQEALDRKAFLTVQSIKDFLKTGQFHRPVPKRHFD